MISNGESSVSKVLMTRSPMSSLRWNVISCVVSPSCAESSMPQTTTYATIFSISKRIARLSRCMMVSCISRAMRALALWTGVPNLELRFSSASMLQIPTPDLRTLGFGHTRHVHRASCTMIPITATPSFGGAATWYGIPPDGGSGGSWIRPGKIGRIASCCRKTKIAIATLIVSRCKSLSIGGRRFGAWAGGDGGRLAMRVKWSGLKGDLSTAVFKWWAVGEWGSYEGWKRKKRNKCRRNCAKTRLET